MFFCTLVVIFFGVYPQLIFSLTRYEEVIDAYLDGLEASGLSDLSRVTSVASFFVSRVDTLVDKMLEKIGTPEALDLRGKVIKYTKPSFSPDSRGLKVWNLNMLICHGTFSFFRLQMLKQLWHTSSTRRNSLVLDGRLW